MEKIINFKAKKKKLLYKTGILGNFCTSVEEKYKINILANDYFLASWNSCIYDNNFTKVFTFDEEYFQLDEYTFYHKLKNIIRFNKQYNNYSILYNINENLDFIFKLDNNIYIFKRNEDLVILEEESNIFYKYELSNVFDKKSLFYDSKYINYFTFNKIKFGLYTSNTFIIFEFKDKAINILNKMSNKLKSDIVEVIIAKENIILFLCEKAFGYENFIYTFNIETMQIISIFNISSDNPNYKIYFSLDDINAFKFMRIIDEDLYKTYHKYIQNKKKVLKIIIKETDVNILDDDVVTNYQIYYIMSNYLIIKGPIIDIGSFCLLYYYKGFDTKKFIVSVDFFMNDDYSPEIEAHDDDYDYSSIQYRTFLKNLERNDFGFLFNKKAIIFYAEGDYCQNCIVYALSYIKFKKIKIFKKIIIPK